MDTSVELNTDQTPSTYPDELGGMNRVAIELTAAQVIDLTRPAMLDRTAWVEILTAARECQLVWEREHSDPWADGSKDWSEFAATVAVTATAQVEGGWSRERPRPSSDANREEYRQHLGQHFPPAGSDALLGRILTKHSEYGDDQGADVFPSNVRIAGELGLSRATVNRHVGFAVANGWLRPTGRRGQAVRYQLTVPTAA